MNKASGGNTTGFFSRRPMRGLADILWKETSGVDHPANEEEGWIELVKGATGVADKLDAEALDALMKSSDENVEKNAGLARALSSANLAKAPASVKSAAAKVAEWLKSEGFTKDDEPAQKSGLIARLGRMIKLFGDKEAEAQEEYVTAKAMEAHWPDFVEEVGVIVKSKATKAEKKDGFQSAVSKLASSFKESVKALNKEYEGKLAEAAAASAESA